MSVKLFGNSRHARLINQKSPKPKKAKTKRTALDRIISILLIVVTLQALYCTAVFSNIPFIAKYRTMYIQTAMQTMRHQWLATKLFPPAVVNAVTDQMNKAKEAQIGVNSNWNQGQKPDAQQPQSFHTDLPEQEAEEQLPEEQREFFELFSEIDLESMQAYVKKHPDAIAKGWDRIYINESEPEDDGVGIVTVQGDPVLAVDAKNGVLLIRVTGSGYRGVLALAKDPARISVQAADAVGAYGAYAGDIAEAHNGVLAMTASGFIDPGGGGNGGTLAGYAMCDGVEYGKAHMGWGNKRTELHRDNLLYITDAQDEVHPDTTDAVEFTPALIVDGEVLVDEDNFWNGINPRAVIGQNANHDIMMLVIEGRQLNSLGTSVLECATILHRYDCMQAMNLDGGSSAIMWFDGEYVTRCGNNALPYGRTLPNAFVYEAAD